MRKITQILILAIVSLTLSSCYNSRIFVGSISKTEPVVEVNKKWNSHFLFGLIPGNDAKMEAKTFVGDTPNYLVKTNTSFLNGLVSGITFGIYTPTQTKFYVPLKDIKK